MIEFLCRTLHVCGIHNIDEFIGPRYLVTSPRSRAPLDKKTEFGTEEAPASAMHSDVLHERCPENTPSRQQCDHSIEGHERGRYYDPWLDLER